MKALEEFKESYVIEADDVIDEDLMAQINNAPVVKLVNSVIEQAVKLRASDVHIEPYESEVRVRFRIEVNSMKTLHHHVQVIRLL